LTILFTDLKSSTQLYREIGDAPAFGLVMDHFDVLKQAIADEGGAIVKTIGDAVMAVFQRPAPALRAIFNAQEKLLKTSAARPLKLKAGIHYGSCIAVNLNDRLDYFGTTVNAASRLVELSSGNDIILSSAVRDDSEVQEILRDLKSECVETNLKGFDKEKFEVWRVTPKD
jgi:class 3 adenylate cyclase